MELSVASANAGSLHSSLSALSVECLDHILSFFIPNGCLNLILTGDKRLIAKVCRTSRLSIRWARSGFPTWKSVLPLVKSFSKLESLVVSVWSRLVLTRGPVNGGFFSPTLQRLVLRYEGCSALLNDLHAPILFKPLVVLEEFTLQDDYTSTEPIISLSHFPTTLRSLRILGAQRQSISTAFYYETFDELNSLPPNLDTLHLNPVCKEERDGFEWPATLLPSLTNLAMRFYPHQTLDITPIAHRLTYLEFLGSEIRSDGKNLFDRDTPLKEHLPILKSLLSPLYTLHAWSDLRNLPPSLVELVITFNEEVLTTPESSTTLAQLNADSIGRDGTLQFAAPRNIRVFSLYDHWRFDTNPIPRDILLHLDGLLATQQSLLVDSMLNLSLPFVYPLTDLRLSVHFRFDWIPLLPPSLEKLSITIVNFDLLAMLNRANPCPNLTSLFVVVDGPIQLLKLNSSHTPSTLTHLQLALPDKSPFSLDLVNHKNLTSLQSNTACLTHILPGMPPNLKKLVVGLNRSVDLANPDQVMVLYGMNNMVPLLRELLIYAEATDENMDGHWLKVLSPQNPPQLSLSRWISLPWSVKRFYAHYYLTRYKASHDWDCELFALSCVPRSLSILRLPKKLSVNLLQVDLVKLLQRYLLSTLKFQFPLLGLPLIHWPMPDNSDPLIAALPKRLSNLAVSRDSLAGVCDCIMRNASGFAQTEYSTPLPDRYSYWWLEPIYHVMNTVSWLAIAQFGPSSWTNKPLLRGYMLTTAIGSAITAPILFWNIHRAGLVLPELKSLAWHSIQITMMSSTVFSLFANLTLAYGLGSTHQSRWSRGLALATSGFITLVRNLGVQALRR